MPYGSVKIDTIIYTRGGADNGLNISGLAEATTGNITLTGTASGVNANFSNGRFTTILSGLLITGDTVLTSNITGVSGIFTSNLSGTTITGNTLLVSNTTGVSGTFTTRVSGATITGNSAGFTTITGATITGTTANIVTISGNTITGNSGQFTNITGGSVGFTTVTGTTVTGTSGLFISGIYSKGVGIGESAAVTFTGVNAFLSLNGVYVQTVSPVAALNIDCSSGNYYTKTISTSSTFTVSNVPASGRSYAFTIELTVTSGSVTWFGNVQWPGGTAPTLITGKTHLISFITDDGGTRWRGSHLTNYTT